MMVGWICSSVTPYYNSETKHMDYKKRPVLIIGDLINNDYTVLPISTVSKRENLHPVYDIKADPLYYPRLRLNKVSFIRVHKQTTVHKASIISTISNLKSEYPDLYSTVLTKLSEYNKYLMKKAE